MYAPIVFKGIYSPFEKEKYQTIRLWENQPAQECSCWNRKHIYISFDI